MDINIVYLICFVFSASYIGTVSINEILLANGAYMHLFTHYKNYRGIFRFLEYVTYGVLLYLFYAYYIYYGFGLELLFIILAGYNISGLLRSFFKDWLFLEFYLYPFFLILLVYFYFYPSNLIVNIPVWLIAIAMVAIFTVQSFLDENFLKRQIDQYIIIDQNRSDFRLEEKQKELIDFIRSRNPYYSDTQIISVLRKIVVKA